MGNYSQNVNLTTQQTTTMRSKASLKFNSLHPESHLKFQNIIRNARLRKNSLEEDLSGNTSDEVSNMLKNKYLSKFRQEDDVCMETRKTGGKLINKKISCGQTLGEEICLAWAP